MAQRKKSFDPANFLLNLDEIAKSVHNNMERELLLEEFVDLAKELPGKLQTREELAKAVYDRGCQLFERNPEHAATACRFLSFAIWNAPEESAYLLLSLKKRFEVLLALKLYPQALSDYEQFLLKNNKTCSHIKKIVLDYHKEPVATAHESRLRLFEKLNVIPKNALLHITYNFVEISAIPFYLERLKYGVMRTTKVILKGEEILKEAPFAFYPTDPGLNEICHNCGTSQFVPISCFKCAGSVVYCSTQCMNQHRHVHEYECPLFETGMMTKFRKCDLFALRMVVTGLPTIVHMVAHKKSLQDIWMLLLSEILGKCKNNTYLDVIKLPTNQKKLRKDIVLELKNSARLALYLRHKTEFFKLFPKRIIVKEWESFIASLVFLHLQQIPCNTRALSTIWNSNLLMTPNSTSFNNGRIQRGYLHTFIGAHHTAQAVFPGLGYCQPRCELMLTIYQVGSQLSLRATRNITLGQQIVEHVESANNSLWPRLTGLKSSNCECALCKWNPKRILDRFKEYKYICEDPKCGKRFSNSHKCITKTFDIQCVRCGHVQQWQIWTNVLLPLLFTERGRTCLFKNFDYVCKHVEGHSDVRMGIGFNIVYKCIEIHLNGKLLQENEFRKLVEICQICMEDMRVLFEASFKDYLKYMLLIWDVIALGNVEVPKSVILSTFEALNVLSIQEKKHLIYYYDDYVKKNVK